MAKTKISIPKAEIELFCLKHHIVKLSLFGSVLRDDFREESDIDVLVAFDAGHEADLMELASMERELSAVLDGHKVDMSTPPMLSRYFRDEVLAEAEVVYDQT